MKDIVTTEELAPFVQMKARYEWWKTRTGFNPKTVLDVGACKGQWTVMIHQTFPKAVCTMVEPDVRCHDYLRAKFKKDALITKAFSVTAGGTMDFWVRDSDSPDTWGSSSLKKERTPIFETNSKVVQVEVDTLDRFFHGDTYDLIKLDTQGTELDIIAGGEQIVSRATMVQIECGLVEYNAGSPRVEAIIIKMLSLGFVIVDILQLHYWHDGQITQVDLLFRKA